MNTLTMAADRGVGDNSAAVPLAEILADEIATDKARADELVAAARSALIANDDDAAKVATLIGLIRAHEKTLDQARAARKQPFLESGRLVDGAYNAVLGPLTQARGGADGRGGLGAILTAWERKREDEARRERWYLEAEQRAKEDEAERARAAAEAARAGGAGAVSAELDAIQLEEEAARLARQAQTLRPEPIRTPVGAVNMRREIAFEVADLRSALGWLVRNRVGEIGQAARTIIGAHLRSMGVDAAGTADIPGVTVTITNRAQVR